MELLSPAGNFSKLIYALNYGADAVYTGGKNFGLRAKSSNLSNSELKKAVAFTHKFNKKIYITVNIFAQNKDIEPLVDYLSFLNDIRVDALIISDPAVFSLAKKYAPEITLHISTQANVTSWKSVEFWRDSGAERIILARELSYPEIRKIREKIEDIELEIFVHGAMCMAYSGRCLLSSFLNNRSANRGNCSQPCRWQYNLVEESRPGNFFPITEDERGTYILNSKDLCLFHRLEEIKNAGIDSIKIEGRMKSSYYTANLTRIYKEALLALEKDLQPEPELKNELEKVSHRHYTEGFFSNSKKNETQYYESSSYIRNYQFIGEITGFKDALISIDCKGKIRKGETIEIIFPNRKDDIEFQVETILDESDAEIEFSKPNTVIKVKYYSEKIPDFGLVRKRSG